MIKTTVKINELDYTRTLYMITETKSQFLEKIRKIDKPLDNLTKTKKENIQNKRIRDERGILEQIPIKYRTSIGSILKTYTLIN